MHSDDLISHWIRQLQQGDDSHAQKQLWDCYFHRLVTLARAKLGTPQGGKTDEEDVALSVMNALYEGFRRNQFAELGDRSNLWLLLVTITHRKVVDKIRHDKSQAQGGDHSRVDLDQGLEEWLTAAPTPELAVQIAEEFERLVDLLPDDTLRSIVRLRLEGYTVAEIASRHDKPKRTIERKLQRIRMIWTEFLP